ncbi:MAG TPA: hypothetical protein VFM57_16135 [Thermoleophilaceae bacterium]|nr:hypothetical protein [Thermoleophilaceae bacterium]
MGWAVTATRSATEDAIRSASPSGWACGMNVRVSSRSSSGASRSEASRRPSPSGREVDLFAAVFDAVDEELMAGIAETLAEAGASDPVAGLRAGIGATLDATRHRRSSA